MTDLAKLSACPFCGGEAEVALEQPGGTGSSGMETPWPFVRCKTAKCIAMPPVVCDDWPFGKAHGYLSSKQARAKAITAWNTRTSQLVERDGAGEAAIKQMAERFLMWKLPANFNPDAGISFTPEYNVEYMARKGKPPMRHEPMGTNLWGYTDAVAMVRHMLGLPTKNGGDDAPRS